VSKPDATTAPPGKDKPLTPLNPHWFYFIGDNNKLVKEEEEIPDPEVTFPRCICSRKNVDCGVVTDVDF
jgi:hypothetical protein